MVGQVQVKGCKITGHFSILAAPMQKHFQTGLVWFRRDLRTEDNAALATALERCEAVHCVFVLDTEILKTLQKNDSRIAFIQASLVELDNALRSLAHHPEAGLIVVHGAAASSILALSAELQVDAVFAARDYEPYATERDAHVQNTLLHQGVAFELLKDHVIWQTQELLTQSAKPYSVFTPYQRAWLAKTDNQPVQPFALPSTVPALMPRPEKYRSPVPNLQDIGFEAAPAGRLRLPAGISGAQLLLADFDHRLDAYDASRNFPAIKGPSYLGVHLRFGTVSIRKLVHLAQSRLGSEPAGARTWLGELIWRDFYFQILANFPHAATQAFKPEYQAIVWESGPQAQSHFAAWCEGRTGYPIVDAAMHQLNQTGYMHNRLRMVAASFLVKHLGIDWRWGERYFAEQLNDFDLSANNGGWQWVSSSGCDAQPYFRIFNPVTQSQKFDAQGKFIQRYLPALAKLPAKMVHAPWLAAPLELAAAGVTLGQDYPWPIVDHVQARERTLARYAVLKK
jgi:deoxyribodipyrimidine photo-lyase